MSKQTRQPDVWVIVDNSTNPDEDWSMAKNELNWINYEHIDEEKPIGWLRNRCLERALDLGADYIVFWDDDDYYPPMRIARGVELMESRPDADIAASSTMYLLLTRENVLMTTGPFHDKHGTGATYTIRRAYAERNRFDPEKTRGEEVTFTKDWGANLVQLNPDETIVIMGHGRNTVDKSDLLNRPKVYNATIINADNGKQVVRTKWKDFPWSLFRKTFSC